MNRLARSKHDLEVGWLHPVGPDLDLHGVIHKSNRGGKVLRERGRTECEETKGDHELRAARSRSLATETFQPRLSLITPAKELSTEGSPCTRKV